jgi:outer membrane protein, heavy metal efflux system
MARIVTAWGVCFGWCVLLLLLPATGLGQTISSGLTLQAAMERAFASNPSILAARLSRAVRVAGVDVAGEHLNPELSFEVEKETPKQSIGVAIPIELGGKRARRVALSEATLRAGDAEIASTIAQVRNDVRRAYFELLVRSERLAVLRELRDLAERVRETAQARFESGDAPRLEVLQAELAASAAEIETTSAQGVVAAATATFNALLGLALDTPQQLSTPVDAGGPVVASAVRALAERESTALAVLDGRIEEQRARLTLAHALRGPDLIPTATLTHDAQPEFTYGWRAGVAVTLPVFTSHKAGVAVEEATLAQLTAEREATRLRMEADVSAAATTAEAQRLAYARYRDVILPQAREVEQLAQDAYRLGQTGIAVLLQALQASRDVRLRALDTAAQFQTALADLERAVGAPLP